MSAHAHAVPSGHVPGAVTHGTSAATSFIDLVLAEDDWVRREFDELVEAGWGGSRPTCPRTRQGAHEPRRSGPRSRLTNDHRPAQASARAPWRTPSRGPPS